MAREGTTSDATVSGGAILGQGTYGCAFSPPLKCRGKPKNPMNLVKRRVGKLTNEFDAYWEMKITETLRKNQLAQNYFILIEESCDPDSRDTQDDPDLPKCKALKGKKITTFKQITMPFGGIALPMASLHPIDFDIFSFTRHLLEAGSILLLSGIVHMDLHPGNIVMDQYMVPRIIDFGLSLIPGAVDAQQMAAIRRSPEFHFDQEPPEVSLLWAVLADVADEDTPDDIIRDKKAFRDIEAFTQSKSAATELEIFSNKSKSLKEKDALLFMQTYWPQYDAWSIGVVLLRVLKQLSIYKNFQFNPTYVNNKEVLEKVVKGLLEPNPMKRTDAIEALSVLMSDPHGEKESDSYVLNELAAEWLAQRRQQKV